ncbi:MAG: hypothetical protein QM501_01575, partial [Gimesia sp.]
QQSAGTPTLGTPIGKSGPPHLVTDSKFYLKGFHFGAVKGKGDGKKKKEGKSQTVDGRALRRQQSLSNANEQYQTMLNQQQTPMPNNSPFGLQTKESSGKFSRETFGEQEKRKWNLRNGQREMRNQAMSSTYKEDIGGQTNEVEEAPRLPLGGPATLRSYTIRNSDGKSLPRPVDHVEYDIQNGELRIQNQQAVWTQAGGISLKFKIPLHGHKLVFSKINGQPKLALNVRSENTYELGSALLWTLFWSVILIVLVWNVSRFSQSASAQKGFGGVLILIGLAGLILLSGEIVIFAMICFISGALCIAYRYIKQAA